jgi:hypothetical protein
VPGRTNIRPPGHGIRVFSGRDLAEVLLGDGRLLPDIVVPFPPPHFQGIQATLVNVNPGGTFDVLFTARQGKKTVREAEGPFLSL